MPATLTPSTARTTRSGAAFSNVIPLPNHIDLEELFEEAERHRAEQAGLHCDEDSVLTSLPSTRSSSLLSVLTDLGDEVVEEGRSEAPALQRDGCSIDELAPLPATEPSAAPKSGKARRSQEHRKRKRQEAGNNSDASKRHRATIVLNAFQEQSTYDFAKAPVTSTGFTCLRNAWESGVPALEDLVGYKLLDWDGVDNGAVTANDEQVIMAMLVGCGRGKSRIAHEKVAALIEKIRPRVAFAEDEREHRRGMFSVKAIGISHGGGQKEPGPLKHSDKTRRELMRIVNLKPMQQIAHVNSGALNNWQPDVHEHYADTNRKLIDWKPRLRRFFNFPKSVWSCLTINFGPRTVTVGHRDFGNLSHGFCAITALGPFNPDLGGHLILRELKLVIRFPPGSSIIVPSALITHLNTDIGPDERRYSVTQYTSGAIFRFVEHGCKLDEEYYRSLGAAGARAAKKANASRWKKGVAMLSRLPKLRRDAEAIVKGTTVDKK